MNDGYVFWHKVDSAVPADDRMVLIVHAQDWRVDVGLYSRHDEMWICDNAPAKVAYWANLPEAPAPPNYQD